MYQNLTKMACQAGRSAWYKGTPRAAVQPVTYEELIDVTDVWVETALGLDEADLRRMDHLARAQARRHVRTHHERADVLSAAG